jgi:nucleoside phosphorylase
VPSARIVFTPPVILRDVFHALRIVARLPLQLLTRRSDVVVVVQGEVAGTSAFLGNVAEQPFEENGALDPATRNVAPPDAAASGRDRQVDEVVKGNTLGTCDLEDPEVLLATVVVERAHDGLNDVVHVNGVELGNAFVVDPVRPAIRAALAQERGRVSVVAPSVHQRGAERRPAKRRPANDLFLDALRVPVVAVHRDADDGGGHVDELEVLGGILLRVCNEVLSARDVHALHDLVTQVVMGTREVDEEVRVLEEPGNAFLIRQIALVELEAFGSAREVLIDQNLASAFSNEGTDGVAVSEESLDDVLTDEAGGSGDGDEHGGNLRDKGCLGDERLPSTRPRASSLSLWDRAEPMEAPKTTENDRPKRHRVGEFGALTCVGVVAALPGELGGFLPPADGLGRAHRTAFGVELHRPVLEGVSVDVLSACSGVGKVAAAHAALALISAGAEALFMVGTCGGLAQQQRVGELIHVVEAVQWDLSVREGREARAAQELWRPWMEQCPGTPGLALTADRPAMRWISRLRRARAVRSRVGPRPVNELAPKGDFEGGPGVYPSSLGPLAPVADMETAAMGAAAERSGIPWASLRVISDAQRPLMHQVTGRGRAASSFLDNYRVQAGRPAEALVQLLRRT